jgi:hypothetical protein
VIANNGIFISFEAEAGMKDEFMVLEVEYQ